VRIAHGSPEDLNRRPAGTWTSSSVSVVRGPRRLLRRVAAHRRPLRENQRKFEAVEQLAEVARDVGYGEQVLQPALRRR
jgi:hypothetical protein